MCSVSSSTTLVIVASPPRQRCVSVPMKPNLPMERPQCPPVSRNRMVSSRRRAVTLLVLGAVIVVGPLVGSAPASAQRRTAHPNILFVLTDDMTRADLHAMPLVQRVVGAKG